MTPHCPIRSDRECASGGGQRGVRCGSVMERGPGRVALGSGPQATTKKKTRSRTRQTSITGGGGQRGVRCGSVMERGPGRVALGSGPQATTKKKTRSRIHPGLNTTNRVCTAISPLPGCDRARLDPGGRSLRVVHLGVGVCGPCHERSSFRCARRGWCVPGGLGPSLDRHRRRSGARRWRSGVRDRRRARRRWRAWLAGPRCARPRPETRIQTLRPSPTRTHHAALGRIVHGRRAAARPPPSASGTTLSSSRVTARLLEQLASERGAESRPASRWPGCASLRGRQPWSAPARHRARAPAAVISAVAAALRPTPVITTSGAHAPGATSVCPPSTSTFSSRAAASISCGQLGDRLRGDAGREEQRRPARRPAPRPSRPGRCRRR